MKKLRLLLVILLAVLLLTPYLLGFEIKSRYRGLLAEFEAAGYELVSHDYQQGFYNARASSVLAIPVALPAEQAAAFRVRIESDVLHGPYKLVGWLGYLADIKTRVFYADQPVFGDAMDTHLHTRLNFSGGGQTLVDLPKLPEPLPLGDDLFLGFDGLLGTMDFNLVNGTFKVTADSDGFRLSSPGQGELVVGVIEVRSDSRRGIADLMLGEGVVKIASVDIRDNSTQLEARVSGVEISAITDADDVNVELSARYAVESIVAAGESYGPVLVEVEFNNINAEAMGRIQQSMQEMQQQNVNPEQQGLAVMGAFMSVLPALLEQDPGFAVRTLEVTTPDGKVQASLKMQARQMTLADISLPDKLMSKLEGDANVRMPETLARELLGTSLRQQILIALMENADENATFPTRDELQAQVDAAVEIQLEGLIAEGLLKREENDLTVSAVFRNSQLQVNGKPMALPAM